MATGSSVPQSLRTLGNSELHLTPIGFGAWAISGDDWEYSWGPQDDSERIAALPADDWRMRNVEFSEPKLSRNLRLVELLCEIGSEHGVVAGCGRDRVDAAPFRDYRGYCGRTQGTAGGGGGFRARIQAERRGIWADQ
jgi:hypothetical protein